MPQPNIILTGFMGTGKTTVGRIIATELTYAFIDTDALIVERAGRSVAEIFASEGEVGFREREAALATELGARKGLVIATGGKMMLADANADTLAASGIVFCLTADLDEILTRVAADAGPERPLLAGPDPRANIAVLLNRRRAAYARFEQIDTTGHTPQAVADQIMAAYSRHTLNG